LQATSAERLLYDTLASVGWDVLYPPRVRLKERKKVLACVPLPPIEFPQFFPSLIMQHLSQGSADTLVLQVETTWAPKAENTTALASAHEDVEGLVRKVALLGVSLRRCAGSGRWSRRDFTACLTCRLMVCGGWWFLRRNAGSSLRSVLFCGPKAPSCVLPSSAHHG
jgi:hypothetical protein